MDNHLNVRACAYRCPNCTSGVITPMVDPLKLKGMIKLGCSCGKSRMTIEHDRSFINLSVPCLLCGREHEFKVDVSLLNSDRLFSLNCPFSEMPVFWSGDIDEVKADLAKTELDLLNLLDDRDLSSFQLLHPDEEQDVEASLNRMSSNRWYDPDIESAIMLVIRELDADHKIYCRCPDDADKHFSVEMNEDGILVRCDQCGASKLIPVDPGPATQAFLDADSLTLE